MVFAPTGNSTVRLMAGVNASAHKVQKKKSVMASTMIAMEQSMITTQRKTNCADLLKA